MSEKVKAKGAHRTIDWSSRPRNAYQLWLKHRRTRVARPKKPAIPRASSVASCTRAMFRIPRMKPFINRPSGAKSRLKRPSRYFANVPLSGSEKRSRGSVRKSARKDSRESNRREPPDVGLATKGCVDRGLIAMIRVTVGVNAGGVQGDQANGET